MASAGAGAVRVLRRYPVPAATGRDAATWFSARLAPAARERAVQASRAEQV